MECRVGWTPSQGLGAVAGKCGICPWCWGSTGWFGEIKRVGLHGREELVVGTRAMSSTFLGCEASMFFICSAGKCGVCLEQGGKLGSEAASPGTPGREDAVLSS